MSYSKSIVLSLFLTVLFISCTDNDDELDPDKLSTVVIGRTVESGAVIACAASNATNPDIVSVFFYPKEGTSDYRLYETSDTTIDANDYSNYTIIKDTVIAPVFNGYLKKFDREYPEEKWVIVTFEFEKELKISNPIRLKNKTKPTVWNDLLMIDMSISGMPKFSWEDNANGDNAIYFEIISDSDNNLLSGTYTYENMFQYYKTDNVVLNITTEIPPNLIINSNYAFTLMDVSEDNWVNTVIMKSFLAN